MKLKVQCKPKIRKFRSFKRFNVPDFVREGESLFGDEFYNAHDVNYLWKHFNDTFIKLCDKYAPFVSVRKRANGAPWLTDEFLDLSRQRDFLKRKFDEIKSDSIWSDYKRARNKVNNLGKRLKKDYYIELFENSIGDTNRTWKTLKSLSSQTKSANCTGLRSESGLLTGDIDKANAFNEYFVQDNNVNAVERDNNGKVQ